MFLRPVHSLAYLVQRLLPPLLNWRSSCQRHQYNICCETQGTFLDLFLNWTFGGFCQRPPLPLASSSWHSLIAWYLRVDLCSAQEIGLLLHDGGDAERQSGLGVPPALGGAYQQARSWTERAPPWPPQPPPPALCRSSSPYTCGEQIARDFSGSAFLRGNLEEGRGWTPALLLQVVSGPPLVLVFSVLHPALSSAGLDGSSGTIQACVPEGPEPMVTIPFSGWGAGLVHFSHNRARTMTYWNELPEFHLYFSLPLLHNSWPISRCW